MKTLLLLATTMLTVGASPVKPTAASTCGADCCGCCDSGVCVCETCDCCDCCDCGTCPACNE